MLPRLPGFCLVALLAAALTACPGAAKPPDLPNNPPIVVAPQPLTTTILYNVHPITAFAPAMQVAQVACPGQPCPARTVMENLEALEQSAKLLDAAKNLAREGRYTEALECLEKCRAMVPGSSVEHRAKEVCDEVRGHVAFDTFKSAFAEAVAGHWSGHTIHPGVGLCWLGQAENVLEHLNEHQKERRRQGWNYLTRTAQMGAEQAFELIDGLFCQATGRRLGWFVNVYSSDPSARMTQLLAQSQDLRGLEVEWPRTGHAIAQPHPCPVHVKMHMPVSGRWTSVPLGAVLADLDRTHAVTVVVDPSTCLDQPVTIDVEHKPLAAVFQMLGQPFGLQPKVQGDCVHLTREGCPAGEECCEVVQGVKVCPETACPKCEKMHVKVVKYTRAGVEEQVNGLMKACYLAVEEQRYGKATDLAREAHALDPKRVEGDPIVYKFGLIAVKEKCCADKCCTEKCGEKVKGCVAECPCQQTKKAVVKVVKTAPAMTGTLKLGVGVNSSAGLTGSVVINERNFDVKACPKSACPCSKAGCQQCCKECCKTTCATTTAKASCCCKVGCGGVNFADACQAACKMMKAICLSPIVTPEDCQGNGCLKVGMSTSGRVDAFCQTCHEGVVYHMMFKDGVFLMWTTPQAKAK